MGPLDQFDRDFKAGRDNNRAGMGSNEAVNADAPLAVGQVGDVAVFGFADELDAVLVEVFVEAGQCQAGAVDIVGGNEDVGQIYSGSMLW